MPIFDPRSSTQTTMANSESNALDEVGPQIILALLETSKPYLTLDDIYDFVERWAGTNVLKGDVDQLLHSYDFPTQPFQLQNGRIAFKLPLGLKTPLPHADAFPIPDEPFRLMDLPLRIRLKIYHYALGMPTAHGWIIDRDHTAIAPRLYNAALQNPNLPPLCLRTWAAPRWTLFSRPLQEILALISTSKAIYNEAMPVFYSANTFRFGSCATLHAFLSGLPTRRPFIKNIILTYDPPLYDHTCDEAFRLLAQTNLKRLRLLLNEALVLNRGDGWGSVARMPGFYVLERIRGLEELSFAGSFQRSKRFLRKMVEPKPDVEPELEELLEEEYRVMLARRGFDLKEEVKRLRRAAKWGLREREKAVRQAEREEERERKKAERAAKRAEREELQEVERRRHKAEVQRRRMEKQQERNREREAKEMKRINTQQALLEKARLMAQTQGLLKRQQEDIDEEAEAGQPRKRTKIATNEFHKSGVPGRGKGRGRGRIISGAVIQKVARGRGRGGRASDARLPAQKPIKTVSGSSRKSTKITFEEQSSSDNESVEGSQGRDDLDNANIDPQLLEIDRQAAQRRARTESTESEAD